MQTETYGSTSCYSITINTFVDSACELEVSDVNTSLGLFST